MARRRSVAGTFVSLGAFALLLGLLPVSSSAAAANSTTMSGALELTQNYFPNAWQPVRLELRNASDSPITGSMVLPLTDGDAPATMRLPVDIPAHSVVRATVWGYFPRLDLNPTKNKQADAPPLSTAEFRGHDGALLARVPVMGLPLSAKAGSQADEANGQIILVVTQRSGSAGEEHDTDSLLARLAERAGTVLTAAAVAPQALTRHPHGLSSIKAVVLDALDPDALDLEQRHTLLTYIRGGGVVVMAAPGASGGCAGSWFDDLGPVRTIGTRVASQIDISAEAGAAGEPLRLRRPVLIDEAVPADGADVLLRGRDYVHVATRSLGLGRIVFTSFPINALDDSQPRVASLWTRLLHLDRPQWEWSRTRLGEQRHAVLGSTIGRKVARWALAAGVTVGYLLLILAAQFAFFGPNRPKAFVLSGGAALALTAALLTMGVARRGESVLQSARLAVIDIAPDGGGWARESVAYVGADHPQMNLQTADETVMLRPALADAGNRPTIRQQPFRAENAQVFADRVERVWEASGPADPALRLRASAQFGPDGLTLDVENGLGATIESPLMIWNGRSVAMADLPRGWTMVRAFEYNPRQQFTGLNAIRSDLSKRRAQVVAASLAPASELSTGTRIPAPPMLVGWIAGDERNALVRAAERDTIETKSMVMVRTPLGMNVAPAESAVSIPAALVHVDTGRLPYDREKGESVPTPQPGSWRIRFAPPPQAGRVRPGRVTISARVSLPSHTLRLRPASRGADEARQWSRKVGTVEMTLNCTERDYDASGGIEMMLDVESEDPAGSVSWQISDLVATIDGVIIGPPPPIVLDAPRGAGAATGDVEHDAAATDDESKATEKPRKP